MDMDILGIGLCILDKLNGYQYIRFRPVYLDKLNGYRHSG